MALKKNHMVQGHVDLDLEIENVSETGGLTRGPATAQEVGKENEMSVNTVKDLERETVKGLVVKGLELKGLELKELEVKGLVVKETATMMKGGKETERGKGVRGVIGLRQPMPLEESVTENENEVTEKELSGKEVIVRGQTGNELKGSAAKGNELTGREIIAAAVDIESCIISES